MPEFSFKTARTADDRPLLSLAMIVRDGGQNLACLVDGARPWVDEIVIGNTGSCDASVTTARERGARVHDIGWHDDFATARNQVLDHCQGAWIVVLDADELLCEGDWRELRAWVQKQHEHHGRQAGRIVTRNYLGDRYGKRGWTPVPDPDPHALSDGAPSEGFVTTAKVRLFPNCPEIRFRGQIHETVESSLWEGHIPIVDLPWPVHHFGYLEPRPEKDRRYLRLAHLKAAEQPHNAQAWAELADCAIAVNDHCQALVAIKRSLVLEPLAPEPRFTAGWLLLQAGDFDKADAQLATVAGVPDLTDHLLADTLHLRAQVALKRDDPRGAAPLLAVALRLFPDNGHYLNTLGSLNLMLGRGDAARRALERSCLLLPRQAEPCLNLALLLEAAREPAQAAIHFAEALRRDPDNKRAAVGVKKNTPIPVTG